MCHVTAIGSGKIWILVADWSRFKSAEPNAGHMTHKIGPLYSNQNKSLESSISYWVSWLEVDSQLWFEFFGGTVSLLNTALFRFYAWYYELNLPFFVNQHCCSLLKVSGFKEVCWPSKDSRKMQGIIKVLKVRK